MNGFLQARVLRQRGAALVESMIAFVLLALGALAVMQLQGHLRVASELMNQRAEAVRLAQQDLERLRSFTVIAASPTAASYAEIETAAEMSAGSVGGATEYRLSRQVQAAAQTRAKAVTVMVRWHDRLGAEQQVVLDSIIAGIDPSYSAALALAPTGAAELPATPTPIADRGGVSQRSAPIPGK
ncbi:MAG: hypothetical protein ACJ8G7_01925 [Rhizobacter sp.]